MVVRKENVHDEFSMVGKYFEECPFLHIVNVSNEALQDIFDMEFTQSIVKAISNEWYVSAIINAKYISNYNIKHDYFNHIHFYGYNLDKNVVYALIISEPDIIALRHVIYRIYITQELWWIQILLILSKS